MSVVILVVLKQAFPSHIWKCLCFCKKSKFCDRFTHTHTHTHTHSDTLALSILHVGYRLSFLFISFIKYKTETDNNIIVYSRLPIIQVGWEIYLPHIVETLDNL
jgi:hypothetical protein